MVGVFDITDPYQSADDVHETYLAHSCVLDTPAFGEDVDRPSIGHQPVEGVSILWDRSYSQNTMWKTVKPLNVFQRARVAPLSQDR